VGIIVGVVVGVLVVVGIAIGVVVCVCCRRSAEPESPLLSEIGIQTPLFVPIVNCLSFNREDCDGTLMVHNVVNSAGGRNNGPWV
jgi:hypothetical protein